MRVEETRQPCAYSFLSFSGKSRLMRSYAAGKRDGGGRQFVLFMPMRGGAQKSDLLSMAATTVAASARRIKPFRLKNHDPICCAPLAHLCARLAQFSVTKSTANFFAIMKTLLQIVSVALLGVVTVSKLSAALPLDSSITYQGRLSDGGASANGTYDVRFTLYDAGNGGNPVGSPIGSDDLTVSNGLFTAALDFGNVFNGDARWLELGVRHGTNDNGQFTALLPRQQFTAAPYALRAINANTVAWSGITGVPAGVTNAAQGDHFGQIWTGSNTNSGLDVRNNNGSGTGLAGKQGGGSGWNLPVTAGVWGDSAYGDGVVGMSAFRGVWGYALGNGENYGVVGYSPSALGHGVYGKAGSVNGGIGVLGETVSPYGTGVRGDATALTGFGAGVAGRTASVQGIGVFGFATNVAGTNRGVYGVSQSPQGVGVYAENTAGGVALKAQGSIKSSSDSIIFYPAWTLRPGIETTWYYLGAEPWPDLEYPVLSIPANADPFIKWYSFLPLTMPGKLYGESVRLKEITIYYEVKGPTSKITTTIVRSQGVNILTDGTDRTGSGSYTITFPNGGFKPANENDYFLHLWLEYQNLTNQVPGSGQLIFRGAKMRIGHE